MDYTHQWLTEKQRMALGRLAGRNLDRDGAETGTEIAMALGFNPIESGQRVCKQLEKRGLAARLGVGPNNAATWTITPSGRSWLKRPEHG